MAQCPICNTETAAEAPACPACGYRFMGDSTQQFQVIPLETESKAIPSPNPDESGQEEAASTLTVQYGRQKDMVYRLSGDHAAIGRSPRCEIFLNDMTVSRSHAMLERLGSGWSIQDNGSFNGVWINNAPVDHAMLKNGDVIQIGCFILKYAE